MREFKDLFNWKVIATNAVDKKYKSDCFWKILALIGEYESYINKEFLEELTGILDDLMDYELIEQYEFRDLHSCPQLWHRLGREISFIDIEKDFLDIKTQLEKQYLGKIKDHFILQALEVQTEMTLFILEFIKEIAHIESGYEIIKSNIWEKSSQKFQLIWDDFKCHEIEFVHDIVENTDINFGSYFKIKGIENYEITKNSSKYLEELMGEIMLSKPMIQNTGRSIVKNISDEHGLRILLKEQLNITTKIKEVIPPLEVRNHSEYKPVLDNMFFYKANIETGDEIDIVLIDDTIDYWIYKSSDYHQTLLISKCTLVNGNILYHIEGGTMGIIDDEKVTLISRGVVEHDLQFKSAEKIIFNPKYGENNHI
jgi:hypothetical protein